MHADAVSRRLKEEFTRTREQLQMKTQLHTNERGELSMRAFPSLSLSPLNSSPVLLRLPSFLHAENSVLEAPLRIDGGLMRDSLLPLAPLQMPLAHAAEGTVFKTIADRQGNEIDFAKRALFS